ncbi:DNA polymerase delta subunit 4-like [Dendronephthya gigantea]|uniref:DNA polymerase delta subunit 4-like n=1 Tax=Dendronephthya gigantea TaxID=151771 RepID=UPI00106AF070|nr:DNA polymerase delta subunit 4-like [Dendronephthya gigantea]
MSAKITDTFAVVKKSEAVKKKTTPRKSKDQVKTNADQKPKVYPAAKDVSDLKILRNFDLRCEFGPCIGISRLERWTRAETYDLNPPEEVKKIIEEHPNDDKFTQCLWYDEELI